MYSRTPISSRQSKNFNLKRKRKRIAVGVSGVFGMVALCFFLTYLFSSAVFKITDIRIAGIDTETTDSIHAAALDALTGAYAGIFSKSSTLFYPRSELMARVRTYPQVGEVEISRSGIHALVLNVTERKQAARICSTLPNFADTHSETDSEASCYFADERGYIFKPAPSFSGTVYPQFYFPDLVLSTSSQSAVGLFATSTEEFVKLREVYETVVASGISVEGMLAKSNNEYELYAHNADGDTSIVIIYFNTISSPTEQISNLISFWKHAQELARTNGRISSFDSIDVRYGSNIYSVEKSQ
jgi:hypothetical protein